MIEINLLPGGANKKKAKGGRGAPSGAAIGQAFAGLGARVKDRWLVGAVAAGTLAVVAILGLFLYQRSRENQLTAARSQAVADSTRFAGVTAQKLQAEATRDTMIRQIRIVQAIDEDRYIWPHVMDEVSRALPQFTWLTSLGYSGTPQGATPPVSSGAPAQGPAIASARPDTVIARDRVALRIIGQTVDIQALTRFMRQLEGSNFINNVQLERSELGLDQGKEVTQFTLTADFSRPDPSELRRVPYRLSVN
jgi:Tfp pilus assembly protein PilN